MHEPEITRELIHDHGLTDAEYDHIKEILGREPNFTELGIFSVMWSEHCSYKNSKPLLKLFPNSGERIMVKAGEENAGCVDIGDGLAVVFKIESHNHPSAIEPFQGAATGVGGILRDIFTMGSRPILSMNSLRFGRLNEARTKQLIKGVVGGIAHYGNCIGVPTVGGEVYFDESYEGNPLVNALSLGLMKHEELQRGSASGVGNPIYYVGAMTGRDGLGGASFASKELTEESHEDRPAVQVGDPFMEKLLLEACLELYKTGYLVGVQDMGAAGLTCSTCETASRGNAGVSIELTKVPLREEGMIPYEIMLSESQERMLIIGKKGKEKELEAIFEKWDLHAARIGEVTDDGKMRVYFHGKLVADIPARKIADESPIYTREEKEPAYLEDVRRFDPLSLPEPADYAATTKKLLAHPSIASKRWVYDQYDHMVRTDTVFLPGHDAALVRIKGTKRGIAIATDCNGLYCYLDPFEGGKIAIAESARNVACTGARPLAFTNCLNFGNPMKPEIFWQFHKCIEGMRNAALRFSTPVTGGNVSFYNENPEGAIFPTPTIGMVGLIEDIDKRVPSAFQKKGQAVYLVGDTTSELGASHYLMVEHGVKNGLPPRLDLEKESSLIEFLIHAAGEQVAASFHDISDGGFAVALAECCFMNDIGVTVNGVAEYCTTRNIRYDAFLFGEAQSRVIASVPKGKQKQFESIAREQRVPVTKIGVTGGENVSVEGIFDVPVAELKAVYEKTLPEALGAL